MTQYYNITNKHGHDVKCREEDLEHQKKIGAKLSQEAEEALKKQPKGKKPKTGETLNATQPPQTQPTTDGKKK